MSSETLAGVFRPVRPGRDCSRTVGGEEGKKTPLSVCQQASRMDGGPPLQAKPRSAASLSLRMSLDPSLERLVLHERLHSRPAFHVTTGVFRALLAMHVSASGALEHETPAHPDACRMRRTSSGGGDAQRPLHATDWGSGAGSCVVCCRAAGPSSAASMPARSRAGGRGWATFRLQIFHESSDNGLFGIGGECSWGCGQRPGHALVAGLCPACSP